MLDSKKLIDRNAFGLGDKNGESYLNIFQFFFMISSLLSISNSSWQFLTIQSFGHREVERSHANSHDFFSCVFTMELEE